MMHNGGRIYISCWTSDLLQPLRKYRRAGLGEMRIGEKAWYIEEPTREQLKELLTKVGFKNIQVFGVYGDTGLLQHNSSEAFLDYIEHPRMINVVNVAYAVK